MTVAGASAGVRIGSRPRRCRWLSYMKVHHSIGVLSYESVALRAGRGCADRAHLWLLNCPFGLTLYSFYGGLQYIISMAEGHSFWSAARCGKGAAKVLHFRRKCNISVFGAPDQRERGAKKGEKCYKKMFQWGCYTFGKKSAEIEAPRERVFELILAAKPVRKFCCSRLVGC